MQNPLEIRDATIEDLPIIIDIYNSTISSRMVTADIEEVTVESRMDWFLNHSPKFRPLWVVLSNGNICAWLSFQSFYGRPAYNGTAEISIYVHEQYRSKGLGKAILEEALKACPQLRINNLLGFIFTHNKPSTLLFKHYDFEEWGYLPKFAIMDGIERDLIIFGKRIAP